MKTNRAAAAAPRPVTHEGAAADVISDELALRRAVLCCLLWEDSFYESGVSIADRIANLVPRVDPATVGLLAVDARSKYKLRHAPLWIAVAMCRAGGVHRRCVATLLEEVIQRPDELAEFLSLYWGGPDRRKSPHKLAAQVKKGLGRAFLRFDRYQLAKWDKPAGVKLRDVMFLAHPKPYGEAGGETFKMLAQGKLPTPDTWETALSAGETAKTPEEKRARWERLLAERKLGAMALLRNLRNMEEAGVPRPLLEAALGRCNPERVMPFRFLSAARAAPGLEPALEPLMLRCLEGRRMLPGHTVLVVDHSYSMKGAKVSAKSELDRAEAAFALAILAREVCERVTVLAFSSHVWEVPPRRGFALRDALRQGSFDNTNLGAAILEAVRRAPDRIIAITDEQTADRVPPLAGPGVWPRGYMVNVGTYKNGVGYGKGWTHMDGWSEAVLDWIGEVETLSQ